MGVASKIGMARMFELARVNGHKMTRMFGVIRICAEASTIGMARMFGVMQNSDVY